MNTVLRETAVSSSSAFTTGDTAAMALPPQMAVPAEMRKAELNGTDKKRPTARPRAIAAVTPTAV